MGLRSMPRLDGYLFLGAILRSTDRSIKEGVY